MIHRIGFLGLGLALGIVQAHDHDHEDHHHHHHHDHGNHRHGLRRNLAPGQNKNLFTPPGKCKDGDETFTVGGVTYECQADFNEKGGQCRTAPQTEEQKIKFDKDFAQWKKDKNEQKEGNKNKNGRQLDGCGSSGCAGINWETDVITIPTWFHVIHNGATGRKFTCDFNTGSGPFTDSDCSYVRNSIVVMNQGFRGDTNTLFPQQVNNRLDTKIQFCMAGVKNVDNSQWYSARDEVNMKNLLDEGGMETLNVYVNDGGGYLGYAYYPQTTDFDRDGVVILNESMPNARNWQYDEGDTLTHEVGHWLNLAHTHDNGCNGVGDYMDSAGGITSNERAATYDCTIGLDNCSNDGGVNPIHSFMSYVPDSCMTEFSAGQALRMQAAYEIYRYDSATSNQYSVAEDGYSCTTGPVTPTNPPTPPPTSAPVPTNPPSTAAPTTAKPTSSPTPFSCATIKVKNTCNNNSSCTWDGNPNSGECISSGGGGGPSPTPPPTPPTGTGCVTCGNGDNCCAPQSCETSGASFNRACV